MSEILAAIKSFLSLSDISRSGLSMLLNPLYPPFRVFRLRSNLCMRDPWVSWPLKPLKCKVPELYSFKFLEPSTIDFPRLIAYKLLRFFIGLSVKSPKFRLGIELKSPVFFPNIFEIMTWLPAPPIVLLLTTSITPISFTFFNSLLFPLIKLASCVLCKELFLEYSFNALALFVADIWLCLTGLILKGLGILETFVPCLRVALIAKAASLS